MEIIDNVNNYTLSLENNAVYVREKQDEYNNLQDFIDSTDTDVDGNTGNIVAIGHLSGDFTNK